MNLKQKIVAEVIPASTVILAAQAHGWDPKSDSSPNDYVEPETYTAHVRFKTVEEAVAFAVKHIKSGDSYWGAEYVSRYQRRKDPYMLGRYEWILVEFWVVTDGGVEEHQTVDESEG